MKGQGDTNMKDIRQIIEQLSAADAGAILQDLAGSDEALAARIVEMALARLSQVDVEEVASLVYDELSSLKVEEVWDRAGRKRDGYVEPGEAADQMIEEALAPLLEDLGKYQKLGLRAEANRMCEGLLSGLYEFEHESRSQFKDWAPDAAMIFAEMVVDAWKTGSPNRSDVKAVRTFIAEELGGWGANLV